MIILRHIITLLMTVSILTAGFLSRDAEFHALLHAGEEFCKVKASECHLKGQPGHHHEGESTEEHPHGLLTLMAGAAVETSLAPLVCPEPVPAQWAFLTWKQEQGASFRSWKACLGRAPPARS